jgi:exonuclease SbcD
MLFAIESLKELEAVAPLVVLRGNHDSVGLFAVFRRLYQGRIYFVEKPRHPAEGGILEFTTTANERIRLATLPYVHVNRFVGDAFTPPSTIMATYSDQVAWYERMLSDGLHDGADFSRDILLFAAHLFVGGATVGKGGCELNITDTYATRAENIPTVSYAAFGHIHKPQKIKGHTPAYYAGSPIQIDFGEESEQKSVMFVEAAPGRPAANIEAIAISGGRKLLTVHGTLDAIEQRAGEIGNSIVKVIVKSELPVENLSQHVQELLPFASILFVQPDCLAMQARALTIADAPDVATESMKDVFRSYLSQVGTRSVAIDRVMGVFSEAYSAVEEERAPEFAAVADLNEFLVAEGVTE